MVKIQKNNILFEQYYEVVNNVKVLQPRYLQVKDRKIFEKNLQEFIKKRQTRKIADSYVFQKSLVDIESTKRKFVKQLDKSRNTIDMANFEYTV